MDFEFLLYFDQNGVLQKIYLDPPPKLSLSEYKLPKQIAKVPVFVNPKGDNFVFLAHLLTSVLKCGCSKSSFHGIFRTKKLKEYQLTVDPSPLVTWWDDSEYKKEYPIALLRTNAKAVKVEGVEIWISSGKMDKFVKKQSQKCRNKGCFS